VARPAHFDLKPFGLPEPRPVATGLPAGVFFGHLLEHWYPFAPMAKMDAKVPMVDHTTLG
jgi:hypothetical protein